MTVVHVLHHRPTSKQADISGC